MMVDVSTVTIPHLQGQQAQERETEVELETVEEAS